MENIVEHSSTRGRSIVTLIVGIVAFVAAIFVPYVGLLGVYGIVLAMKTRKSSHRWFAYLGMTFSILAIVWMLFVFVSPLFPHTFPFNAIIHSGSSTQ